MLAGWTPIASLRQSEAKEPHVPRPNSGGFPLVCPRKPRPDKSSAETVRLTSLCNRCVGLDHQPPAGTATQSEPSRHPGLVSRGRHLCGRPARGRWTLWPCVRHEQLSRPNRSFSRARLSIHRIRAAKLRPESQKLTWRRGGHTVWLEIFPRRTGGAGGENLGNGPNDSSRTVGHGYGHVYGHARAIPI
jgi:hypothetical protein